MIQGNPLRSFPTWSAASLSSNGRKMATSTPGGAKPMPDKRIALVTGANQGVGLQVAKELAENGLTVLVGSRNFERGEAAAKEIGPGAIALQLDVTDRASIAAAAES